jgi:hypothetical protein
VAGAQCEGNCNDFLVPKGMHWHIYPLPAGSTPKQAMLPEGVLEPRVHNGVLSYYWQNILQEAPLNYHKGQNMQAGISLYIPVDQLSTISIEGVDLHVQIHADQDETIAADMTEPLRVVNQAVDTNLRVSSPYWAVQYEESGVDNDAWMDVAAGSSVDVSGVDINAHIQCPEGLTVRAHGVDNDIFVQGPVASGRLDGVDANLRINDNGSNNNPCANVSNTGVSNDCGDTNDAFEMEDLTCLADTETGYECNFWWPVSTAGSIALGVGLFIVFAAAIAGSIFCCARGCCCREDRRKVSTPTTLPPHPPAPAFPPKTVPNDTYKGTDEESTEQNTIVEAEVLEIKNTNNENPQFEDVDLEYAKGGNTMTPYVY